MLGQPACHPGKSVHNIKYGTVLGSSIFHPRDIVPREEVPVLRRRQRGTKREATFNRIRRPESSSTPFHSQPSVSSRLLLWALLLLPGNDSLTGRFVCPSFLLPLSDWGHDHWTCIFKGNGSLCLQWNCILSESSTCPPPPPLPTHRTGAVAGGGNGTKLQGC